MTTSKKKKKSARERRVLVASIICAGLIVAGSTFAWFTSTDEVTNRLTATADYGVSIVEDFTPPKDMTPGQDVNKDVSAVNTGSIDAVLRLWLENELNVTTYDKSDLTVSIESAKTTLTDGNTIDSVAASVSGGVVTDGTKAGFTKLFNSYVFNITDGTNPINPTYDTSNNVWKLGDKQLVTLNPMQTVDKEGNTIANEVTTLQAGGQLVVAASKSLPLEKSSFDDQSVRSGDDINALADIVYSYTESGSEKFTFYDGTKWVDMTKNADGTYTKNTAEVTSAATASGANLKAIGLAVDYSGVNQYKPAEDGLYLFRRYGANTANTSEYTYAGYYYKTDATNGNAFIALTPDVDATAGTYTVNAAVTVGYDNEKVVNSINDLSLRTIETTTVDATINGSTNAKGYTTKLGKLAETGTNDSFTPATTFDGTTVNAIEVTYVGADTTTTDDDVVFYIKLADDWSTNWTYVAGEFKNDAATPATVYNDAGYFYYNYKIGAGKTTPKLIDSVKLSNSVKQAAYVDLVYDLNVHLDSAQVTKDNVGNETLEAVVGWATPTITTKANTTPTEIESIAWAAP